ncbi:MAG: ATP-binding cassette domain-containing protein [Rhodocyclaceae bacterium]|nr:ATP-binding cassette domain-containing protein [Rhodocyclaceae bacterium]
MPESSPTASAGPLIRIEHLSKIYPIASTPRERLQTLLALLAGRRPPRHFDALQDINLEVRRGESLGLIGVNGAGKSTLLKAIAGVVKPTSGTIHVHGRISALLELGAGFHPQYTGRQNVHLATALLGLSERETLERMDSILAFADIGEHIDQPIKHYSSGMVVRLGFAVATVVRPDLLITDEVLAVGDESFQRKCVAWMRRFLDDGGTLLLCAHSMFQIQKLCHKAAWIHAGRLRAYGDAMQVTKDYLGWHDERAADKRVAAESTVGPAASYATTRLALNGLERVEPVEVPMGGELEVSGRIYSPDGRAPVVALGCVRIGGAAIYGLSSDMECYGLAPCGGNEFAFRIVFGPLELLPGHYEIRAHAMDPEAVRHFDDVIRKLEVTGATRELGSCRMPHRWLPALPDTIAQPSTQPAPE